MSRPCTTRFVLVPISEQVPPRIDRNESGIKQPRGGDLPLAAPRNQYRNQQRNFGRVVQYHGRGDQHNGHAKQSFCLGFDVAEEPLAEILHHSGLAQARGYDK